MNLIITEEFKSLILYLLNMALMCSSKHKDLGVESNFQGIRFKSIEHQYDFGGAVDDIWQKKMVI